MSTMEPDEGAQSEDRQDAPRWDTVEAANPPDAPDAPDAPRWDEVQEPGREDAPRWDEVETGSDDPDASTDS
jgi:hypothetical protein